jgi:hypothetical protein
MATVQDIENARRIAVRNADRQIVEAIARRDGARNDLDREKLDVLVDELMRARREINGAACEAEDNTPEMEAALTALGAATEDMKRVAEKSKKLTQFITLASEFLTAGLKFSDAIRKPSG